MVDLQLADDLDAVEADEDDQLTVWRPPSIVHGVEAVVW